MARPRTPVAVAKVTGAADRSPGRHRGRNDPSSPLIGAPSRFLPAEHKRAWRMFVAELPWLVEADRPLLELASSMRASFMIEKGGLPINSIQVYSAILSKLGATPVDRSRTQPLNEEPEEDEFFGRN